ncbi:MAG: TlpA family protein disulfide reductase [Acidobacteriia bacterium]|nr:TlpA family protein disulfide reductase [Terriglobia bacterium]
MKRSVLVVIAVIVVVSAALFFASHRDGKGTVSAIFKPAQEGPAVGAVAPDFTLKVLGEEGSKNLQLSSLRGKAVLINFWATYCGPCKVEMPWLIELQNKYGPQGFQIVGVAEDEAGDEAIVDFAHKMKLNYPVVRGTNSVADQYPGDGLPLSFYIDRSGKVVYKVVGLVSESVMEDAIKKSLAQGGK